MSPALIRKLSALMLTTCFLAGCYDPNGPVPEAKKAGVAPDWTDADVDAVVQETYESVPAIDVINGPGLPAGCNQVHFIRFKTRDSSDNAADADAEAQEMNDLGEYQHARIEAQAA